LSESQHPSSAELAQYAARTLSAPALLAVDDHLMSCRMCRTLVSGQVSGGKLTLDDPTAHLTFEQLEAIAEGRAAAGEHARECDMCAAELRDLKAFVSKPKRTSRRWLPVGLVVAASIALAVFVTSRPSGSTAPAPVRMAMLRDGALTLTFDENGHITGAPFDAAAVNAALESGEIAGPALWKREREQLLGEGPAGKAGSAIAPVAETVEADRPVFRWTAVPGSLGYRVEVYDAKFNEVASSSLVKGTEWRPERPLPRGGTYTWIVEAGAVRFPQPPAPEARFAVLGAEAAAEVAGARQTGSRLLLAVVAGRHGLWSEAWAAADEAARENPGNEAVARLRRGLEGKR
jgi:hypothetical protein